MRKIECNNSIIKNCYHQSVTEDVISEDKYLYMYVADETQPCTTLSDLVILVPSYLFLSLSLECACDLWIQLYPLVYADNAAIRH